MPIYIKHFDPIDDFSCFEFKEEKYQFPVYRNGIGPGIIIMPEMPEIHRKLPIFLVRWLRLALLFLCRRCLERRESLLTLAIF